MAVLGFPSLICLDGDHNSHQAFNIKKRPGQDLAGTLAEALRGKDMLLVLDNCEHLIDAAARLMDVLLDSCPRLRILATGREALGVAGEAIWPVSPLSVPDPRRAPTVVELEGSESVRLFVDRAHHRNPAFVLERQNARPVAEICRRLDGIPLAIELAAARVGLSVQEISERLEDSLKLLTGGDRTAAPRHRTLRGTLDWSHELLGESERRLFRRLSVFAGGWTLEAAEEVGAGEGIEEGNVVDLLSRLADKSLVVTDSKGNGALRYRFLEPVRQYARERLEESEEGDAVRLRHALWFLALAEDAEPELRSELQGLWLERLETEHDNLRAALSWLLGREEAESALRLAGALGAFWSLHGYLGEGRRWMERALANSAGVTTPTRLKVLAHAGYLAWEQHDHRRSSALSEEMLALSEELEDDAGSASALLNLGAVSLYENRLDEALALFEECLSLSRQLGDKAGAARMVQALGMVAVVRHEHEEAMRLYEECQDLCGESGDELAMILSLGQGAFAFLLRSEYDQVAALCRAGVERAHQIGSLDGLAFIIHAWAALEGERGRPARAARLWGAGQALLDSIGITLQPVERHHYGPYISAARAQLDEATWNKAWGEGHAMTTGEAVEYALSDAVSPSPTAPETGSASARKSPAHLTRRETEVATLVGTGLTNRRIASELVISERTVDHHVASILKKLNLHSREQVAARMTER